LAAVVVGGEVVGTMVVSSVPGAKVAFVGVRSGGVRTHEALNALVQML